MLKVGVSILVLLFLFQCGIVRGNPLLNDSIKLGNTEVYKNTRTSFTTIKKEPRFLRSWSLPFPIFSINSLFRDRNDDMAVLKQNIIILEKNQEEILKLLKQLIEVTKISCGSSPAPTYNDNPQKELQHVDNKEDLIVIPIIDHKEDKITENMKEGEVQNEFNNGVTNNDVSNINIAEG